MRTLRLILFLCAAAVWAQTDVVAIRGARVVDGTGAPARMATVVIRGALIEAVGPNVAIPEGARVIDASGQTLIPGLFDLHTHLNASAATGISADWGKNVAAYLDCGVTTVNDMSTYGEMIAPMHRLIAEGVVKGPRVNMAARLSTPGGHGTEGGWGEAMTQEAATPEQAHARMKAVLGYKPDIIKIFTDGWRYDTAPNLTSMNLETLTAMVQDAHAAGLKVFTHTVTLGGAKIAARAGVDVLAHGIGDAPVDQELIDLLKAKGTFYVPTLAVYEPHQPSPPPERALLILEPMVRNAFDRPARTGAGAESDAAAARRRRWQNLLTSVRRLNEAGVPVATGTDAGMAGTFHGYATLRELELLVEAGMKPLQAVTAATGVSARALGVDKERGTITEGKTADLVLVDGRPDENVADIEKTARVFLGGVEVDRKGLEAAIQSDSMTALPAHAVEARVDDMESSDGRTQLGTMRVNSTDGGVDHSAMLLMPVTREDRDHALLITARMAAKARPYVRLELPLTPGGVEEADLSRYTGVTFDARGEGTYRLLSYNYGVRAAGPFAAPFSASAAWQTVRIPFSALERPAGDGVGWNPRAVRTLAFEISGPAESTAWLELDNVRFY